MRNLLGTCSKCQKALRDRQRKQCASCYWKSKIIPIEKRFFNFVKKTSTCWIWRGYKGKTGYGVIGWNKKVMRAHRVSWEIHRGKIPESMKILHKCDIRSCVNPKHLWVGTQFENIKDRDAKKRQAVGEKNRHKLTENKVNWIRKHYKYGSGPIFSKKFGVSSHQITAIVGRHSWTHI